MILRFSQNSYLFSVICFLLSGMMSGCAATREYGISDFPQPEQIGVYHKVSATETLWQIAKKYDVPIDDIVAMNNIPNEAHIERNQLLFIPNVDSGRSRVGPIDENQDEFVWPVQGKIIRYFYDHQGGQANKGIDIQAQDGETVKAARAGQVVFADYLSGYQYTVILDHRDGFHSVYAQNSELLVKMGEWVVKGKAVSQVGRTQETPYLHFEIRKNSIEDNPLYYLP